MGSDVVEVEVMKLKLNLCSCGQKGQIDGDMMMISI
jgi:hypothetical protein